MAVVIARSSALRPAAVLRMPLVPLCGQELVLNQLRLLFGQLPRLLLRQGSDDSQRDQQRQDCQREDLVLERQRPPHSGLSFIAERSDLRSTTQTALGS